MAEDVENKPKFILNKQKNDAPSGSAGESQDKDFSHSDSHEKKKVIVVKKKVVVNAHKSAHEEDSSSQPVPDSVHDKRESTAAVHDASSSDKSADNSVSPKTRGVSSIELSPPRPNIKQGNLADKSKTRYPPQQGPRKDGPREPGRERSFDNRNPQQRREGGFTGAQAREGYQNRSDRGTPGGYQGDQNRGQGGYQGGQSGGYQGGQNRGPGAPGGYQGGGYQGGQNRGPGAPGGYQGGGYQGGQNRGPGGYQGGQNRGLGSSQGGYQGGGQGGPNRGSGGYQGGYQGGQNRGPGAGRFPGKPGFGGNTSTPIEENKKIPAKKTFKAKKTVYSRKDREGDIQDKLYNQKKKQSQKINPVPEKIDIMETISVSDLAKKMNLKASELIGKLMTMGMMVSITQSIDADTATLLASEYGCDVHIISLYDETVIASQEDKDEDMASRPPVVTIMGHVDHGKTKTLDAIRSANVVATEFGGITQHIGAYMVETHKGKITFLDTPGHEAFTMMRARGAKVTDIVVLVVAADDGVMPQTVEAINHAKDAQVPIIVAVNKIDKPEANPDKVKTQLSEMGLMPEDWGGTTQYIHISALKKEGLDDLLDAILLQAEILELKANWNCRAEGKIVESRIDHGRGVVSTIIVERGTLRTGDPYVAGVYAGRIRAIFNDRGQKINEATPSMPVEILGLEAMPMAGDPFQVTENEKTARAISDKRQELKRFEDAKTVRKITLDNLYETIDAGESMELKVIIKSDVQGSAEALKQSLEKLTTKDIRLAVIHASAGAINESDVMLAAADSNAIIIGFNVRPTPKAKLLADQEKVDIRKYNIIYKAVEEITLAMEGMLKPDVKEEVIGMLEVRDIFKVPKIGTIAGSYVTQGIIKRSSSVNVIREGIVIYSGKVTSLKRFKDDAKEVSMGFECGVGVDSWHDIKVGDQFEVFEYIEVARKLGETLLEQKAAELKKAGKTAEA